ncbi:MULTISPECIES: 4'-phosphopantetheinyl transferase superfamily protein [unclassified Streptomyces]|uniref:4'-phosphopantetheinyl transferase family protein n=1 Tax=unclassified Streptomyces TaxID=2593676 RepID=UPI0033BF15E8
MLTRLPRLPGEGPDTSAGCRTRSAAAPAARAAAGPPGPLVMVRPTADVLPLADSVRLAPYEQERAARLPAGPRRDDFVAAHVLVRLCAARFTGAPAATLVLGQICDDCGAEDHGRPFLRGRPDVGVSLSHARGAVAAAAGPGPVGVDVEDASGAVFDPRVAARVLAPAELAVVRADPDPAAAFLRLWVRKEALVKVGVATLGGLRELDLMDPDPLSGWRFLDWSSPDGAVTAAAVARITPVVDSGDGTSPLPYSGKQQT